MTISARDAFLSMIEDGDLEINYDYDYNGGRWIDKCTYALRGDLSTFLYMLEVIKVYKSNSTESVEHAIERALGTQWHCEDCGSANSPTAPRCSCCHAPMPEDNEPLDRII